jgi:hypothetical protein
MPPALLEIPAAVLGREELERKIHTTYDRTASYKQFVDYRSEGDTRLQGDVGRLYRTPYGALASTTTILSATSGNKAALERWNQKNPGKREEAAKRGTLVHSYMERYMLGERNFEIDPAVEPFWRDLPKNLDKLGRCIWAENPLHDAFPWCVGADSISRVWHPGRCESEVRGWAGAPDLIFEYKGKIVLGDLKTSANRYYARWPGPETPKSEYGLKRAGFLKYEKCQRQMASYALACEHTIGIKPEILMTFVCTEETTQVFAIQGSTIDKYKEKWWDTVDKFYDELSNKKLNEIDMEVVDGDKS